MRTLERNLIDSGPTDRDLPVRPRRLRRSSAVRRLVRESRLSADMLVYPMFVATGQGVSQRIEAMPGQRRLSADLAEEAAASVFRAGVPAVLLFGSPRHKDDAATDAFADDGAVQKRFKASSGPPRRSSYFPMSAYARIRTTVTAASCPTERSTTTPRST